MIYPQILIYVGLPVFKVLEENIFSMYYIYQGLFEFQYTLF